MLRELRIKNFAVIDQLALDLSAGLNVLTGETGAGKSIILNALGLLSGGRVSSDIIRQGEDEASVEALFSPLSAALREKIREAGYDDEEELVVRRIISRTGKNRAYLNGSLCPATLLSEIGAHLIHIYGQHEHHALLKPEAHLSLLDSFAGHGEKGEEMKKRREALGHAWERLSATRENLLRSKQEEELLKAQADEIAQAKLRAGEDEELRERKNILLHAEKLYRGCKEGEELLYEGENALAGRLGRYALRLRELANIDGSLSGAVELLESALAQLEEANSSLRRHTDRIQFEPGALEQLEDRLAEINRLRRKYNASVEEILNLKEKTEDELRSLDHQEEELPLLEKAFESTRDSAWQMAETLSNARRQIAKKLKREMEKEVASLGMPRTIFEVRFLDEEGRRDDPPFLVGGKRMTAKGIDQIEFLFSPNPGEAVKPLAKIASGGELSRLMLAIKSLVLTQEEIPTLLFDEVDAGIGGAVAEIVGKKLKKVASAQQVICVTHLPQIAALADLHYGVRKEVEKGRTFTEVNKLSEPERVDEVARMLAGVKVTEKAKRHAEEMVKGSGD
ncbi:MAG: DNA repair protein RecN [Deltaproteobacteria bacterium]|nr:DNA repair protein RecN [Deltaproteobacteria bacterium]